MRVSCQSISVGSNNLEKTPAMTIWRIILMRSVKEWVEMVYHMLFWDWSHTSHTNINLNNKRLTGIYNKDGIEMEIFLLLPSLYGRKFLSWLSKSVFRILVISRVRDELWIDFPDLNWRMDDYLCDKKKTHLNACGEWRGNEEFENDAKLYDEEIEGKMRKKKLQW